MSPCCELCAHLLNTHRRLLLYESVLRCINEGKGEFAVIACRNALNESSVKVLGFLKGAEVEDMDLETIKRDNTPSSSPSLSFSLFLSLRLSSYVCVFSLPTTTRIKVTYFSFSFSAFLKSDSASRKRESLGGEGKIHLEKRLI